MVCSSGLTVSDCLCRGHQGTIWSLAASSGHLYSGSSDGSIKMWDIQDLRRGCLRTVSAHKDGVSSECVCEGFLSTTASFPPSFHLPTSGTVHDNRAGHPLQCRHGPCYTLLERGVPGRDWLRQGELTLCVCVRWDPLKISHFWTVYVSRLFSVSDYSVSRLFSVSSGYSVSQLFSAPIIQCPDYSCLVTQDIFRCPVYMNSILTHRTYTVDMAMQVHNNDK